MNNTTVANNDTNTRLLLREPRYLMNGPNAGVCYCPTRAVAARAPSEAEVMDAFRSSVVERQEQQQGSSDTLQCISSVGECQFGTRFEASFLLAFVDDSNTTTSEDFATESIEVGFQNTLNSLLYIAPPGICQPDFRLTQTASATIINLSSGDEEDDDLRRRLLKNVQRDDQNDNRRVQEDMMPSTQTTFPTASPRPFVVPSPTMPTAPPTSAFVVSSVFALIRVTGVCNGCSSERILENQLTILTRKLEEDSKDDDPYAHFLRILQQTTTGTTTATMSSKSNCFCPIESAVQATSFSLETVLNTYQSELDDSDVQLDVRGVQEVQVLNCEDESEEFDTQIILLFAMNPEVSNSELSQLVNLIEETYNEMTDEEYCDLLIRRIERIDLVSIEGLAKGQNECDLFALTFNVLGSCRGCENGSPLFDEEGNGERRLMRGGQDTFLDEFLVNDVMDSRDHLSARRRRRRLQDSGLCLCERGRSGADRAPALGEFEDVLGPQLQRRNFDAVCGVAEQFEEIRITETPSSSPSTIPSESPTVCTIPLENTFTTEIVLFVLENGDGLESEDIAIQLGLALEAAFNETVSLQFNSVCDPLYREVTSVTPLMGDGLGGRERRLRGSLEVADAKEAHSTRQDDTSRHGSTSRNLQESGSVRPVTYLVTGQCGRCSADSNILDVVAREEVLSTVKDVAAPTLGGTTSILAIQEIDKIACSDTVVEFEEVIIVELVPTCPEEGNFGFDEALTSIIAETFVSTFNRLAPLYCDELFRRLSNATVENVGTITTDGNVPVEIRVVAECLGCDPDEVGIYGSPSTLGGGESGALGGDTSIRALQNVVDDALNPELWVGSSGRLLQNTDSCICDAQALADRSPLESEFLDAFRQSIESLPLDCVESVAECQFGSTFDTDIVISFEGNQTTLTDDVQQTIQVSLLALLNELYKPSEDICNPEFRTVLDVNLVFDFTLNGEFVESSAATTMDDGAPGRFLSPEPNRRDQMVDTGFDNVPPTSSPTTSFNPNAVVRTLLTVSGVCNSCLNELFLSNQVLNGLNRRELGGSGKHDKMNDHHFDTEYWLGRQLQDRQVPNSNCFCPLAATVNVVPPSAEEVQGGLNRRLEEEDVDLVVRDIDAVSVIDCDAEEETTRFESEFTFYFSAFPSVKDREIQQLGAALEAEYNDLVEDYCDPLIRRDVNLRLTGRRRVISSRRHLQDEGVDPALEQEPPCVNYQATFEVIGSCRGCEDGTPLLDSQSTSRGLLSKEVHDRLLSRGGQPSQQRTRRRHLMNDKVECFCDSSTIAPRAPNVEELWLRLQPRLESFVDICGEPVQCDPNVFVSQLTETTILALLLEPGTVLSEMEIIGLETTYLSAYNEVQSRLRVDKCGGRYRQLTSITADRSILDMGLDLGEGVVRPGSNGGRRKLSVQSFTFTTVTRCTRECKPEDDVDIIRAMIDPLSSVSFVREVLAVNEFLTDAPSSSPSLQPSVAPLASPSESPSKSLSTSPSEFPSLSPSKSPSTSAPTRSMSSRPSSSPSESPLSSPSKSPSVPAPSSLPSMAPSSYPSTLPSEYPSEFPSEFPSVYPSGVTTAHPSSRPTTLPSVAPSLAPSFAPSELPSLAPSSMPSATPTLRPSFEPSQFPSLIPSSRPSVNPSSNPSSSPSQFPSVTPSASPPPSASSICSSLLCDTLNPSLPDPNLCAGSPDCTCSTPTCPNCIGSTACDETTGPIGDNSCLGISSCLMAASSIGSSSCHGEESCSSSAVAIPDNACQSNFICSGCRLAISSGQCNDPSDFSSCPCLPTFGSGSCVDGNGNSACFNTLDGSSSIVGSNSCTGEKSCDGGENLNIMDGACTPNISCRGMNDVTIGNDSCRGNEACRDVKSSTIGTNSCNENGACINDIGEAMAVTIGDNSCNHVFACRGFQGNSIGNNSCNIPNYCRDCAVDVGDNEWNLEGTACPCTGDTATPSKTPTAAPVV